MAVTPEVGPALGQRLIRVEVDAATRAQLLELAAHLRSELTGIMEQKVGGLNQVHAAMVTIVAGQTSSDGNAHRMEKDALKPKDLTPGIFGPARRTRCHSLTSCSS